MGTVLGRSTVVGIILGFAWLIADLTLGQFLSDPWKVLSLTLATRSLQAYAMDAGTPYPLLSELIVVLLYLVLPVAIAAYNFRQRDIFGPA